MKCKRDDKAAFFSFNAVLEHLKRIKKDAGNSGRPRNQAGDSTAQVCRPLYFACGF
jgi:hypothetical protein